MRKAGDIPYINIGRGRKRETPRYDLDDLIAWREKRKANSMSVYIRKTTKDGTYSYDFQFKGDRFQGNTGKTRKREAEEVESSASGTKPAEPGKPERPSTRPTPR